METMIKQLALFGPFIICLFSAAGLFFRFGFRERPKRMLALFMLAGSAFYFLHIVKRYVDPLTYSYWYTIHIALLLLAIPQIYFYVHELTIGHPRMGRNLIHLLPALFFLVFGSLFFYRVPPETRLYYISQMHKGTLEISPFAITFYLFNLAFYGQFVVYALKTHQLLQLHKTRLNQLFSEVSGYELNWVKHFLWMTILWGFAGNYEFLAGIGQFLVFEENGYVINLTICLLIILVYLLGTIQKSIPYECACEVPASKELSPVVNHRIKEKLHQCFEQKKIFLRKELTIWDVCRELNSNRTYVSNFINEEFGVNFNGFVNKYRIEYAKKLLADPEYLGQSLNDIALMSGFNTLISFNRAFQKCLNCTPGSFRKEFVVKQLNYK